MTASATVVATISWFQSSIKFDSTNFTGKTAGAYFHSGDGSEDDPYTILSARNFYNLAWLQDMGMFNQQAKDEQGNPITDEQGNPVIKQYYFKLHDNLKSTGLDMGGWTIPPIGTKQYPFLGQFIGNDVTVSNFTISNDFTDYGNNHPNTIDGFSTDGVKQPEIVGIFGVVGEIAGSGTYTYDSQINTISNFAANDFTVKSNTSKVLIGLTAGYVNGEISNVALNNGSINVAKSSTAALDPTNLTSNLSDYTSVGYCTAQYKTSISSGTDEIYGVDVENKEIPINEVGEDGIAAGGTIKMTDIYNRLKSIYNSRSTTTQVVRKTIWNYPDKDQEVSEDFKPSAFRNYHSTNYETGNYQYAYWSDTAYMCMAGGHWENNYTVDGYYEHTGYPITNGVAYLNVDVDSISISSGNDPDECTLWTYTLISGSTYYISTEVFGETYYLCYDDGDLNLSDSQITNARWNIDDSGTYRDIIYNGNINYHIAYNSNTDEWYLRNTSGTPYYLIYDGSGHYMKPNTNSYTYTVLSGSESDAIHWSYDSAKNAFYYNTNLYLTLYAANNAGYVHARSGNTNYWLFSTTVPTTDGQVSNGRFSVYYNRSTYYMNYNGNANSPWRASNRNTGTALNVKYIDPSSFTPFIEKSSEITSPREGPDYYLDDDKTFEGMKYDNEDTTYFPLNVVKDGTQNQSTFTTNYLPSNSNTGYVVSGSSYDNGFNDSDTSDATNIRVSQYAISNISSSYSNGNYVSSSNSYNIFTLNSSYEFVKANNTMYENFDDTLDKLKTDVLSKSSQYVYGLHFMNAQISKDALVTAKYAKLNTSTEPYSNYQMPANSINFNLIEKGNIKLFGGMYFNNPNNDAFMSLHQVKRNKTTHIIEDIKEIEEVYSDGIENHSYIYKFTDGKYSKAFQTNIGGGLVDFNKQIYVESLEETALPTTYIDPVTNTSKSCLYSSVFNTQRMTNHWYHAGNGHEEGDIVNSTMSYNGSIRIGNSNISVNKTIMYFEIPMNEGEFCLGSVKGGTGGYLFYLDIGANAKKLNRTKFTEHYVMYDSSIFYPNGVAFMETTTGSAISVTNGTGAFAKILPSYNSTVKIQASGTGVYVASGYNSTYIIGAYKNSESVFKSGAPPGTNNIDIVLTYTVTEIRREQYFDFDSANQSYTQTIVTNTKVTINENVISNTTVIQQYSMGTSGTLIYDSSDEDLDDTTGIKFYNDSGKTISIAGLTVATSGTATEVLIVTIDYDFNGSGFEQLTFELNTGKSQGDAYFSADGWVVTYTVGENGTMTIDATKQDGLSATYSSITIVVSDHYVVTISDADIHG